MCPLNPEYPDVRLNYMLNDSGTRVFLCQELNFDEQICSLWMTSHHFDLTQKNIYAQLITGGCFYLLPTQSYDANVITDCITRHVIPAKPFHNHPKEQQNKHIQRNRLSTGKTRWQYRIP